MKKILVAVDFSESSLNALKYAVAFAKSVQAELSVMTVYNTMNYTPLSVLGDINKHLIDDSVALKNKLEKLVAPLCKKSNVPYKTHCIVGIPEIEIQKFARKFHTSLIIMGQTGSGGIKKFLLGSTTSHVVNTSGVPVLIVPVKYKFKPYKKIAFTSDLNPKNISFMKGVIEFAKYFDSTITVLYIDTEGGYEVDNKILQMQGLITKKYGYEKIKGVILNDIKVQSGINEYINKHKPDIAVLVKYHPGLSKLISAKTNSGRLADSFNLPVLVLEASKK